MRESFIERWTLLLSRPGTGQEEVDIEHPLRFVYGTDTYGDALFFVICDEKPDLMDVSDIVRVERGVRSVDGKWTLSLTLVDSRFVKVFMRLGEDLVRRSSSAATEAQALKIFGATVAEWKNLLTNTPIQRLSKGAVRGLLAELWFGFVYLGQDRSAFESLTAWSGPLGRPQDFHFSPNCTFEVKSVYPDSTSVKISSAAQLDSKGMRLILATVTLIDVSSGVRDSFSVSSLIAEIEEKLSADSSAVVDFHRRLRSLGIDLSDDYYSQYHVSVVQCGLYLVDTEFPAIRQSELAIGVESVSYSILLAAVANARIKFDSVWKNRHTNVLNQGD